MCITELANTLRAEARATGCTRMRREDGQFVACGAPAATFTHADGDLAVQCVDHPFPSGWALIPTPV
jgi:hypothetical protein